MCASLYVSMYTCVWRPEDSLWVSSLLLCKDEHQYNQRAISAAYEVSPKDHSHRHHEEFLIESGRSCENFECVHGDENSRLWSQALSSLVCSLKRQLLLCWHCTKVMLARKPHMSIHCNVSSHVWETWPYFLFCVRECVPVCAWACACGWRPGVNFRSSQPCLGFVFVFVGKVSYHPKVKPGCPRTKIFGGMGGTFYNLNRQIEQVLMLLEQALSWPSLWLNIACNN